MPMSMYEAAQILLERDRRERERALGLVDEDEEQDEDVEVGAVTAPTESLTPAASDSPVNALDLDHDSYERLLRAWGIATDWHERRLMPPRPKLHPSVAAALQRDHAARHKEAEDRAAALEAGRVDGRSASPEELRKRMADLGLGAAVGAGMFSSVAPKPPVETATDPDTKRRRIESEAEESVRRKLALARAAHRPLDVRAFSDAEWAAYRRLRGLSINYIEGRSATTDER